MKRNTLAQAKARSARFAATQVVEVLPVGPAKATRAWCSACGSADLDDVQGTYSACCNQPVVTA
jgi:hypothetical protein